MFQTDVTYPLSSDDSLNMDPDRLDNTSTILLDSDYGSYSSNDSSFTAVIENLTANINEINNIPVNIKRMDSLQDINNTLNIQPIKKYCNNNKNNENELHKAAHNVQRSGSNSVIVALNNYIEDVINGEISKRRLPVIKPLKISVNGHGRELDFIIHEKQKNFKLSCNKKHLFLFLCFAATLSLIMSEVLFKKE